MDATPDNNPDTESSSKMGYSKPGTNLPNPLKFKCMATGSKRQDPCDACTNTSNCMTDSLQIKEPTVDKMNEKSVLKIDSDGNVKACAKGDASQCGYKAGAKVCGKCGAMAVEVKFVPGASSEDDEEAMDFAKTKGAVADADYGVGMEREKDEEVYDEDNFGKPTKKKGFCQCDKPEFGPDAMCTKCGKPSMMGVPDAKGAYNNGMTHVDDPMDDDFKARRKARHRKRMAEMGMKADDMEEPVSVGVLVESLRRSMGAAVNLYFAAHAAHWNVEGPDFAQYHELFGEIYNDVYSSIDPFAENIRKLGAPAPAGLASFSGTNPPTANNSPRALVGALVMMNGQIVSMLKRTFDVANELNEQGVANFIAERIDQHQKWQWFLTSSAKSNEMKSLLEEIESKSVEDEQISVKDAIDDNAEYFLCAASREVKSIGEHSPCADCTGRCVSSDARPDLLEIEAMAQDLIGGKVLFSAYSDEFDMFAVQVRRKDGQPVEVYFASDGEHDGWLRIPESSVYTKSADVVDLPVAIEAALEVIEGKALAIAVGRFEDQEAFLVDVDGLDGKSYEVAVAPNGTVYGFTERVQEEKRMFSPEEREGMAKEGEALPDGSYPIANEQDLKNAIQAFGRAKDPEAAKAHIMKRAKALGLEDLIPEDWMGGEDSESESEDGEKSAVAEVDTPNDLDPSVAAALLELELMSMETEIDDLLGDN